MKSSIHLAGSNVPKKREQRCVEVLICTPKNRSRSRKSSRGQAGSETAGKREGTEPVSLRSQEQETKKQSSVELACLEATKRSGHKPVSLRSRSCMKSRKIRAAGQEALNPESKRENE